MLQDEKEITEYCNILASEAVQLYLEIGSKFGGSLWRAAMAMPKGSRIVSIDLPNGTRAWRESGESLRRCIDELNFLGYDAKVIWGSSQASDVIRKAQLFGPYDCIMIDADHRLPGLTADWENYQEMSRNMIAFHDIAWRRAPTWEGIRIDVPEFWNSVKRDYRYREIIHCPTGKNNGIGILWKD
jgi:predicted O-methyltransferase YrrM